MHTSAAVNRNVVDTLMFSLGALTLLFVPGEPVAELGRALERAREAPTAVVGLAQAYLGYVETPEAIRERRGESRRTYFGPETAARLTAALDAATAPP